MIIKIKKLLLYAILRILNPMILWSYGWKRKVRVHKLNNIPVYTDTVWEDPKNKGTCYQEDAAIMACESRYSQPTDPIEPLEPLERDECVAGCPECIWGGEFPAKDYCEGYEPPGGNR